MIGRLNHIAIAVPDLAKAAELYRRPWAVGYRLAVTLKADAPAGTSKHDLYLKTNDQASPMVPLLIRRRDFLSVVSPRRRSPAPSTTGKTTSRSSSDTTAR